jgi:GNAT superfamily N-acetyltransferase
MEKNLNTPIDYRIVRANNEQMEWVFNKHWGNPEERQKARERFDIIFVAIDENENILGRLMVIEKPIPPPLNGIGWWIANINTYIAYRRKGIAAAMLDELKKHAEQAGISFLFGMAEPTRHASMFWFNNNFSLQKCGKQCDDKNNTEEYGNYQHIMFYRINKMTRVNTFTQKTYRIIKADKEQLDWIYNEHIINESPQRAGFYETNRNGFFGFAAIDDNEKIAGIITARADELDSPLIGTAWAISYIFVRPDLRRQGIGSALINEIIKAAEEAKIEQVLFIAMYEEAGEFLNANNLDLFFWKHLSAQNKIISAGLRIL